MNHSQLDQVHVFKKNKIQFNYLLYYYVDFILQTSEIFLNCKNKGFPKICPCHWSNKQNHTDSWVNIAVSGSSNRQMH